MNCKLCQKPLKGSALHESHPGCHYRMNPPTVAHSMNDMVRGGNPIIASRVMQSLVPNALTEMLLRQYNKELMMEYVQRCDIYKAGE